MDTIQPTVYSHVMTPQTASEVTQMMRDVVDEGTGTPAQLGSGIPFAGKTGTASIGPPGANETQPWFIGFAPANDPKVAVAVDHREDERRLRRPGGSPDRQERGSDAAGGGEVAVADPEPDTMVDGRYRVLSRLGTGGMAEVYLAEDQQLGRKVALKLLHRRFSEDPDFVERFRREAQAAAGLQHPNVVSVYDRGAFDDTYYIAMEYLRGRSLKQLIREEAPLDPLRAIDITIQILKAARFAHARGVIHRDLKPHNVIVDDSGHAKVTDFGIARAGASDMTETGSIMGTAQYLSPEQAQGHAGQRPVGPVLGRRRALRDADRAGPVRRRVAGDDRAQARLRGADSAERDQPRHPAGARADRAVGAQQGPGRPARGRRPADHRARALPRGDHLRRRRPAHRQHGRGGGRRGRGGRERRDHRPRDARLPALPPTNGTGEAGRGRRARGRSTAETPAVGLGAARPAAIGGRCGGGLFLSRPRQVLVPDGDRRLAAGRPPRPPGLALPGGDAYQSSPRPAGTVIAQDPERGNQSRQGVDGLL